jgi:hypothetical protein
MNAHPILIACSTCRTSMVEGGGDAAGWSIFFLLVVILSMLGGICFFMFRIARREKENFDPLLSDDLSSTSTHH